MPIISIDVRLHRLNIHTRAYHPRSHPKAILILQRKRQNPPKLQLFSPALSVSFFTMYHDAASAYLPPLLPRSTRLSATARRQDGCHEISQPTIDMETPLTASTEQIPQVLTAQKRLVYAEPTVIDRCVATTIPNTTAQPTGKPTRTKNCLQHNCLRKQNAKNNEIVAFTPSERTPDDVVSYMTETDSSTRPCRQRGRITITLTNIDKMKKWLW